ncbi:6458_t:CDS:1, partial [Scutellospora calospora]
KRKSESLYRTWYQKSVELSKYGSVKLYKLLQQVKSYHKQYDNVKKQAKDAEILYLRCKNVQKKAVPPKEKLISVETLLPKEKLVNINLKTPTKLK